MKPNNIAPRERASLGEANFKDKNGFWRNPLVEEMQSHIPQLREEKPFCVFFF
jgi:hypothetical protein